MRITVAHCSALAAAFILTSPGCQNTQTATDDTTALHEQAQNAEIVLVLMRADWCAQCRVLGNKLDEVMPGLEDEPVKLVVADLTDIHNPAGKAVLEAEGLGKLYESNRGKTGILYLIDAETGEIYDRVYSRSTVEQIRKDIERALEMAG